MNLTPKVLTSDELNFKKDYVCPLCRNQSSSKNRLELWVLCPLVAYQAIAEKCCFAIQKLIRNKNWENHPKKDQFLTVAVPVTKKNEAQIRTTCLEHQKDLIRQQIQKTNSADETDALLDLMGDIQKILEELS